jgi:hypothetical protein
MAAFFGLIMLGIAISGVSQSNALSLVALLPCSLLLWGSWIEARKARWPNELTIDQEGIHLDELGTSKHWQWKEYLGVICNNQAVTRSRFYTLKVRRGARKGWRLVTIGPFAPGLAETLRDYAQSMGRHVPLMPDPYFSD